MFRTVPLSIIRSFSLYTQQWYMSYRFAGSLRAGSGRNSFLILLASCNSNLYDMYHCCVYSEKLLMVDRGTVRTMWSFIPKINRKISASSWFYYKNYLCHFKEIGKDIQSKITEVYRSAAPPLQQP